MDSSTGLISAVWILIGMMIFAMTAAALLIGIYLLFTLTRYNWRQNSLGLTGRDIARKILDDNGLEHIRVRLSCSMLLGNSYSHYFRKVRLRWHIIHNTTVASLAMAAQTGALAILDARGDEDMKRRIRLAPIITLGPISFVPLVVIGVMADYYAFGTTGTGTLICSVIAVVFYALSFVMSLLTLKTEKKAQNLALEILQREGMATDEELESCRRVYRLFNLEYICVMLISALEMLLRLLDILSYISKSRKSVGLGG